MSLAPWQTAQWSTLQARRDRGALPHALLLAGPAGLGKREFARAFAYGLLCAQPVDGHACGHCRNCLLFAAGTHPDWLVLGRGLRRDGTERSEIVIDQIRELAAKLAMSSQFGGWQVACIDPADAMNTAAANALLKTLEEPSGQTLLLLLADAPWRLPATIRSRCQRIEFHLPETAQALAWLNRERAGDDGAQALAAAGGNPGLARDWLRSGQLEQRTAVRGDLAGLAAGRSDPGSVARRWVEHEPAPALWFAAQAASDELQARAQGRRPPLGSALDDEGLWRWHIAANQAREDLRGPLRADLLLLDLLARWR
ncbi:MAG: DNA polymerase III subunit delta' [Xanthomonadales bacterium]|nr:DNA polymerase III subunit delta' [Xanthomonadales bacterium]